MRSIFRHSRYWEKYQQERIEQKIRLLRHSTSPGEMHLEQRIEQLEDDLGRTLLLLQSLAEVCISKQLLGREEIAAMAEEIDLGDGAGDGQLSPKTLRPEDDEPAEPLSPREHLRRLEEEA